MLSAGPLLLSLWSEQVNKQSKKCKQNNDTFGLKFIYDFFYKYFNMLNDLLPQIANDENDNDNDNILCHFTL